VTGAGEPAYTAAVWCSAVAGTKRFWQIDEEGRLLSAQGHISLMVADADTPRLVDDPVNCPNDSCAFDSRIVFYWLSDRAFPFATKKTLSILRRSALWAVGLLDSVNRSDIPFRRGDANADGRYDLSDAVFTLSFLFLGGSTPPCLDAVDADDNEALEITDAIFSLNFLFLGGPPPRAIANRCFQGCGLDFTPPGPAPGQVENASRILSCLAYPQCRS
jgi:hypothetical protein